MSEKLNKYISTSPGFQYSINLKYDLYNSNKVTSYIPLSQATSLITDIVLSNSDKGTIRSRIVVGNYGTGKSHLSAVLLSILSKIFPLDSYNELLRKIEEYDKGSANIIGEELFRDKMLPVIVEGSGQPLNQLLLSSLQVALNEAGLDSIMPETFYSVSLEQIETWRSEYPEAYKQFRQYLIQYNINERDLLRGLENFDKKYFDIFNNAYSDVNHGAIFQPLFGGFPADIFVDVARKLPELSSKFESKYRGIIILFDEFGKYLEQEWENRRTVDLKPLQDFAEACNSSAENPIQLVLITHKPISQYAIKYGQDLVNEWKKVEGRFKNIELVNQPTKDYEIMSHVIIKNRDYLTKIQVENKLLIDELKTQLIRTRLFSDLSLEDLENYVLNGCFPLHPITVFSLPRFSQKVAQNERTVFTFLCTSDFSTLGEFLNSNNALEAYNLLTLDVLYDYFNNQMKTIESGNNIHQTWLKATAALSRLNECDEVEAKIIKVIAVIRIISLPTILPPTFNILKLAFLGSNISIDVLAESFRKLINIRIIYEGTTTGMLDFIEPGEIDIEQEVNRIVAKKRTTVDSLKILNEIFPPHPVLAKRYNEQFSMIRFFSCRFVALEEINNYLREFKNQNGIDGYILYILPTEEGDRQKFKESLPLITTQRVIFVVPKLFNSADFQELDVTLRKLDALKDLLISIENTKYLEADHFEIVLRIKDIESRVNSILARKYDLDQTLIYNDDLPIVVMNRSELSRYVSDLCFKYFDRTPRLNNELINKHNLTKPIINARQKVTNGLLAPFMEPKLGIQGSGPELAIFRCLISHKGIITGDEHSSRLNNLQELDDPGLVSLLLELRTLFSGTPDGKITVEQILKCMCNPPYGVRMGVVPILLAIILREQLKEIILVDADGKEIPINAENIDNALRVPQKHFFFKDQWSQEKTIMCKSLEEAFRDFVDVDSSLSSPTKQVVDALRRWYFSLPRFTRDSKRESKLYRNFMKLLKSDEQISIKLLFESIPKFFVGEKLTAENVDAVITNILKIKQGIDGYLTTMMTNLELELIQILESFDGHPSLLSALKTWYESLPVFKLESDEYSDGTQRLLNLIETFKGENSAEFLYKILLLLTGLRPEDWNDKTVEEMPGILDRMLIEVNDFKYEKFEEAFESDANEVIITFPGDNGNLTKRFTQKETISETGSLLKNTLWTYINNFGDSIPNTEKRQILISILERLIRN